MDYQVMFNVTIAVAGFVVGWLVNRVFALLDRIDADMKSIPIMYVTKDDYREDIREIKETIGYNFKRLDTKADK